MLTLLLGILVGIITGYLGYLIYPSFVLASITFVVGILVFNFFMGRYFMNKLTAVFNSTEKDIKSGKADIAIEKMKTGYKYAKWQFLVKQQIDSQIGIILYANKRFDEALPYLKNSLKANWMSMSMLAAYYYKQKDYANMKAVMEKSSKANKKDSFTQCLYAYFLSETRDVDGAIAVLAKAMKKLPSDERLQNASDALKNKKKIKMQAYGTLWLQLHLAKMPDGIKQYQTLIGRQKITRR